MRCAALAMLLAVQVPFRPPSAGERIAAIGDTSGLPVTLRRALVPGEDFEPLARPGRLDWLANHPEPGQTFDQFTRVGTNRPDAHRRVLYLQPLGAFAPDAPRLDLLSRFTAAFFMLEVRILPAISLAGAGITKRRHPATGDEQLLTTDILNLLRRRLPADAFALLGITMHDLYPDPAWNFVFGQASLRDRVGVYSFARYGSDDRRLLLRRSVKVLAHETAHMFGIQHCIWFRCVMNGSNHLAESDSRPLELCPIDLRKLQSSVGFDVAERYRRVQDFDRTAGFDDAARWIDRRLSLIRNTR